MSALPNLEPTVACDDPSVRLYAASCLTGMKAVLGGETVSVVVTSPPHNLNVPYGAYRDRRPREQYLSRTRQVAQEITRVLTPDGSLFLSIGGSPSTPSWVWEVASQFHQALVLQNADDRRAPELAVGPNRLPS